MTQGAPAPGRTDPVARLHGAALRLLDALEAIEGPRAGEACAAARARLRAPVSVLVAGRVSSGKSTLVNALVGALVAPTAARELTAVLTVFRFGAPARVEVHHVDGSTTDGALGEDGVDLGAAAPVDVAHVRVAVPEAALRQMTLVDTPGLGSATTDHARRALARLVGGVLPDGAPDVVLYVVRDEFRDADQRFVNELTDDRTGAGAPSTRVLVALSHADNFGGGPWGVADPIELARERAAEIARRHPVAGAVAISGLLAETARTGRLRESHVRALRRLAPLTDDELSVTGALGGSGAVTDADLALLQRLLGGYGLRHGRHHASSSIALRAWLEQVSGVEALERELRGRSTTATTCERVDHVLAGLERGADRDGWTTAGLALLERARFEPDFHPLSQWRALAGLRRDAPDSHDLIAELDGLLAGTAQAVTAEQAVDRVAHHQSQVGTAATGAEAHAATVLARSYLLAAREVRDDG